MKLLVLTNNKKLCYDMDSQQQEYEFIDVYGAEILLVATEKILQGARFAADPLAGYYSRPNPYHTMFFIMDNGEHQVDVKALNRIELMKRQWEFNQESMCPITDLLDRQYQDLDFSLASNTLASLKKTPSFYSFI